MHALLPHFVMMAVANSKAAFLPVVALLFLLLATTVATATAQAATCVPTLQRMLSCLDFIEHRSDAVPLPCCAQLNATVAEQPCCLMHVVRGNVAKLVGPEFDVVRAMVNVTTTCLGDASVLVNITRSCSGKPLPPLTPEFPFTSALPPPPSSGATRLKGSWSAALSFVLLASVVYHGGLAVLWI